ncbi:deaminase [Actinoplanes sp. NBC_00393]|uniref:deaminase n=1 Tax=Actinoplanes sp. NBC_00393 TaxID=2975953 RepID=UPI002E1AE6A8
MTAVVSVTADTDRHWMHAAITVSRTAPLVAARYAVGAVIVDHDGTVLATGYTGEIDPTHHAEEVALAKLPGADLSRATIYTTLEPCTTRRSRPASCTNLVLAAGINRVVLALREPLLFADCDGVETLRGHGIDVLELPDLAHHVREANAHVLAPAVAP